MKRTIARAALAAALIGCTAPGATPSRADTAEACARFVSCGGGFDGTLALGRRYLFTTFVQCTAYYRASISGVGDPASEVACAAEALGCAEALACRGEARAPAACAGDYRCDGDRVVACLSDVAHSYDCAALGQTCVIDPLLGARCGAACEASFCDGDVFVDCRSSVERSRRRCPSGTTCTSAGCVGTGAPCAESACAGDVHVYCFAGREGPRFDCGALGAACRAAPSGGGSADPCMGAPECAFTTVGRCEGDTLVICGVEGEESIDCRAAGFDACAEGLCV